ncbi:hypothetical protein EGW08_016951 [Elysia chlorotica]|uniref:CS domain-containing protein n=1 Tax=Elysia chlorotica TaxID=188477 RepID=A0A433T152_ELYCH|nr:hypothetical protein EGW08_016951 [Elysia chlorotica]
MTDKSGYKVLKRYLEASVPKSSLNQKVVTIELCCDKLEPSENRFLPKNGTCDVKFFPDCQSLQVDLVLKDREEMTKTKYTYKVRQLPGRIVPQNCTWTVLEGKILIKLCKEEENEDWTLAVSERGVDQVGSDESS